MYHSLHTPIFIILIPTIVLVFVSVAYIKYSYAYWKRRNMPYIEPKFPFGSGTSLLPKGPSIGAVSATFYQEFRKKGYGIGGVYIGLDPKVVLMNPDLIKDVLIKDFQYFTDRGVYQCESDPLSINLISQEGVEWRNARRQLSSIFTSGKIKQMFQTMLDCTEGLELTLDKLARQNSDVDILEVGECYITDVTGSCFLGIDCNSFKHRDAEFRQISRKFFTEFNFLDLINLFMCIYFPNLSQKLRMRLVQKNVSNFFFKSIQETVKHRESNNVRRNDLLQLLIDLKNSEVNLSMNELIAQAFIFFVAGFETSSSTITFALFEVSQNGEIQEKIRREVLEVLDKYNNKLTYDALGEMTYLKQAIDETLRIWSPVPTVTRVCTQDYKFKCTDMVVEKGIHLLIPVRGIHHDPEYWPDPTRWDPDRFSAENKRSQKPFTYLPFGEGSRNCIGLRLGVLQTKIALATILSKYKVTLSLKTITPLDVDMEAFILHTHNTVYLNIEKI